MEAVLDKTETEVIAEQADRIRALENQVMKLGGETEDLYGALCEAKRLATALLARIDQVERLHKYGIYDV